MNNILKILFCSLIFLSGCTSVFFQPQKTIYIKPTELGLVYEDVYLTNKAGLKINGWFLPAKGKPIGTILYLHGNAENISTHVRNVQWLPEQNFNVFLIDYQGYGNSEGTTSLKNIQDDINDAMSYLLNRKDIDKDHIAILAQSLGGAAAIYNVANSPYRKNIRGLITDSAFSGYRSIAQDKLSMVWLSWLPLALTIDDEYSPIKFVSKISPIPLLIIHGDKDVVVPLENARKLFEAAGKPKELWIVPNIGHIEAFNLKSYQKELIVYLKSII